MNSLVLLALVAGLPVLLAILLRVNSVYIFASIASGYMLQNFIGDDTALTLRTLVRHNQIDMIAGIILLTLPVLFTLLVLRKTLPTRQLIFQIVLLAGNGLTLAILIMAISPPSVIDAIKANPISHTLYRASDIIVATTAVLNLLLMWFTLKYHQKKAKHHR